jgi:hypothetical protein
VLMHEKVCNARPVGCKHCGANIASASIRRHEASCSQRSSLIVCQYCDGHFESAAQLRLHEGSCDWEPSNCSHCNMVIIARDLGKHEERCATKNKNKALEGTSVQAETETSSSSDNLNQTQGQGQVSGKEQVAEVKSEGEEGVVDGESESSEGEEESDDSYNSQDDDDDEGDDDDDDEGGSQSSDVSDMYDEFAESDEGDNESSGSGSSKVGHSRSPLDGMLRVSNNQVEGDTEDDDDDDDEDDDDEEEEEEEEESVRDWDVEQVCRWLWVALKIPRFVVKVFRELEICGDDVLEITDADLVRQFDIQDARLRRRILDGVQALNTRG